MGKTLRNTVGLGLVVGGVILAAFAGWRHAGTASTAVASADVIAQGRQIYANQCAACHGESLMCHRPHPSSVSLFGKPGAVQDDFDLLLTNIVMPGGMNGRELADRALADRPSPKVLFNRGYTETAIVHRGRLDPGVALLSKPCTRLELANKVRDVLENSWNAPVGGLRLQSRHDRGSGREHDTLSCQNNPDACNLRVSLGMIVG